MMKTQPIILNIIPSQFSRQGNKYNDIVINEIMYAPSSGDPEWIEIYNRSSSAINLKGLSISDNSTKVKVISK